MAKEISSDQVIQVIRNFQKAAKRPTTKSVSIDGQLATIPYPYPSPADWRDHWIYFLMIDRFNNPDADPKSTQSIPPSAWNQKFDFRQGGTFKGVRRQLSYIADLGAKAIWLSPVLKNSRPDQFRYNYTGYATQDFLNLDERFASDGTLATAERELTELVEEAHARGLYVILDVVINHSARVFDYLRGGQLQDSFDDAEVMNAPFGAEPSIEWLNGFGFPRADWLNDLPPPTSLSPDDAVWPADLQRKEFFRRRGNKLSDTAPPGQFARGDFGSMRQLVAEYDAEAPGQHDLRDKYGRFPVLSILITIHQYLIARYDVDGFRIDTVKYVAPDAVETFGNAMREFALSAGKRNFFTFGEIFDDEKTIANFVGRNSTKAEGFGIDAALDFPLFFKLPQAVKGNIGVEAIRKVFRDRKDVEKNLISSHGEAGKYFVSFLDNHDQHERFNHQGTPAEQLTMGIGLLFSLQGIPSLYYGTEQGLQGTSNSDGSPSLDSFESVREALWGKGPVAFDRNHPLYTQIKSLSALRDDEPAMRYGRIYFREASANAQDFGHSEGKGGLVCFSRVLTDREVLVIANTNFSQPFSGSVIVDLDLNRSPRMMRVAYSNIGTTGTSTPRIIDSARIFDGANPVRTSRVAALPVHLGAMELQILVPAALD
jgi:glycosidase